jgi:hypothetical protein
MEKITLLTKNELDNLVSDALQRALEKVETPIRQEDCLMTREETSEFLKINLSTLHAWTQKSLIPVHSIGNRRYYKRQEIIDSLIHLNKKRNEN